MGWRAVLILTVTLLTSTARSAPQQGVPSSAPATAPGTALAPDPTLDRVEALLAGHRTRAAHDLISPWLKSHPRAADRDRGLYLLAQVYFQSGDRVRSFYHLDELLDNYPASKLFFPALQLQYDIADAYLGGYTDTFLGLPVVSMEEEGIEMLFRIQERSPGSPVAERSLRRSADYYFNTSQFDLAGDAYEAFLRMYPRSPDAPQVRLRQAFSSLARFRGPRFDATPLIDARAQFKAVQSQYPELAAEANVPQWIDHIDSDLARKAYITADFYKRTGKTRGAVYMYRYVVQTYPNSREAGLARAQLSRMPAWALDEPAPPASNPEAAAQPTPDVNAGRPTTPTPAPPTPPNTKRK